MSKKQAKKILEYTVIFEPAEEGGYVAYVPALPGCVTQGETLEEVYQMAKDAVEGYLSVLRDAEEKIPEEKPGTVIARIPALVSKL